MSNEVTSYVTSQLSLKEADLRVYAEWLRLRMVSVVRHLDTGKGALNALGEVQNLGITVDRLCAEVGILRDIRDLQIEEKNN